MFRFLYGVGGEECCVITAFTHGQSDETFFCQLKLAAVSNKNFGRDFSLQLAQCLKAVNRQITDRTAALRPDDIRTPAVSGETVVDPGCQQKCGVTPQIVVVILLDTFTVVEIFNRVFNHIVRKTQQKTRCGQAEVTGIFRLTQ